MSETSEEAFAKWRKRRGITGWKGDENYFWQEGYRAALDKVEAENTDLRRTVEVVRKIAVELTPAEVRLILRVPGLVNPDDRSDVRIAERLAAKLKVLNSKANSTIWRSPSDPFITTGTQANWTMRPTHVCPVCGHEGRQDDLVSVVPGLEGSYCIRCYAAWLKAYIPQLVRRDTTTGETE